MTRICPVGREEFRIPARYTFISVYGSIKKYEVEL